MNYLRAGRIVSGCEYECHLHMIPGVLRAPPVLPPFETKVARNRIEFV
jgi:hypothetical protein